MAENSKIEWTDHTANLWWGCTKVHAGCDNCYAERISKRYGDDVWGNDKSRRMIKSVWKDLEKYQRDAEKEGVVKKVFVGSMMDIFEKPMPLIDSKGNPKITASNGQYMTDNYRHILFEGISMGRYNNLLFLFLTKRPSNINKYIPEEWKTNPPKNVMFGTSPVDQETADKLIPQLLKVNGRRFLSIEPQLGEFRLNYTDLNTGKFDWVIQGGESGHNRRPFDTDWARNIRDDCAYYKVPYFFKQVDKVLPVPEDLQIRQFPIITNQ